MIEIAIPRNLVGSRFQKPAVSDLWVIKNIKTCEQTSTEAKCVVDTCDKEGGLDYINALLSADRASFLVFARIFICSHTFLFIFVCI